MQSLDLSFSGVFSRVRDFVIIRFRVLCLMLLLLLLLRLLLLLLCPLLIAGCVFVGQLERVFVLSVGMDVFRSPTSWFPIIAEQARS